MSSICPVCREEIEDPKEHNTGSEETEYDYSCRRCGDFRLANDLSLDLESMLEDEVQRAVLSHWIRTKYEALRKEQPNKGGYRHKKVTLAEELVNSIIKDPRPSVAEQANNYVLWIGDNVKVGGRHAPVERLSIQAIVGSANEQEFELVSHHLLSDVKLIDHGPSDGEWRRVTLSFDGWERYRELKRSTSDSRKAFMAMQYDNKQLDDIFDSVFKDAVAKTGFDLFKLVDAPQPAGLIDDDLRVKIRASRFLIADLTDRNPGAYWEAGYAEGLGKPVIYTCEKTKFENSESRPHFDTNHHLTILWEWDSDKRKEASEKLKSTIRATLPAEAKLEDE